MGLTRRKKNTAGFTLTEVIISSLIAAFLLVALLASFIMGRTITQVAKHHAQATNQLRARLEYLKGLGYDAVNLMNPVVTETNVPIDSVRNGAAVLAGTRTTTITDTDADDVLEITVRIEWSERHMGQTVTAAEELRTLMAPY
jgi:type II secretory pathway pseudopilin PulG